MSEIKTDSFLGYMDGKKLVLNTEDKMKEFISELSGEVMITIEEVRNRTQKQNNYYRKIIREMAKRHPFDGYHADELHEAMKQRFEIASTKDLNKEEFSLYIDKVIKLASEHEVQLRVTD
tara:strand:+ start:4181 stop:4540 length:360 start_codon:yes stop_codon:yes gene_type:complete